MGDLGGVMEREGGARDRERKNYIYSDREGRGMEINELVRKMMKVIGIWNCREWRARGKQVNM